MVFGRRWVSVSRTINIPVLIGVVVSLHQMLSETNKAECLLFLYVLSFVSETDVNQVTSWKRKKTWIKDTSRPCW